MDKDRIRRAAMGGRKANEQRRLIAYSVLLVLLVGYYVFKGGGDDLSAPATDVIDNLEAPRSAPPLAQVDPARLAEVNDAVRADRATLEPGATRHLMEQAAKLVYGDLEQLGLRPGDWDELVRDGPAHRGEPVWVLGELQWLREDDQPPFGWHVRGEVRDRDDKPWNFIVVTEPVDIEIGDVVKLSGFFLKHYDLKRPDRAFSSGPMVIGEEMLRSAWPIEPVTELRADLFSRVQDFDLTARSRPLDSPEFYELLSYVNNAPEEVFLPEGESIVEYGANDLMLQPEAFRGRPLRISGLFAFADEVPLGPRGENPLGVPFIWRIWLTSYQGTSLVYSFEPPPPDAIARKHVIDVDGMYYRGFSYENQVGSPHTAAVVIARHMQRYHAPPNTVTPAIMWISIGIAGVLAVLFYVGTRSDRRGEAEARQRRIQRQKKLAGMPSSLPGSGEAPPSAPTAP